jgi:hypothetical protein
VAHTGKIRHAYKTLVRKPESKRLHGRPMHTWEYNIGMYFGEMEWESVAWILLAHNKDQWQALVNMIIKLWVPKKVGTSWLAG